MDGAEAPDPPEKFVEAYRLAKRGGLRLTAHACEDAPAQNITTCLDLLGCERIDHGYHILGDDEVVKRALDDGITFTVCPTATAVCYFDPDDFTKHPIREMASQGLKIMLNSDDPPMFHTDIGKEYVEMTKAAEWPPEKVREFVMNGVEAAWVDEGERRRMRAEFERELDEVLGPDIVREYVHHDIAVETEFAGALVEAMATALRAEDPGAVPVPYMLSGGTDAKQFARLGIRCFGFSPVRLPADLNFGALFHGIDERIPVEGLQFGVRVLDRFLSRC
jgi:hypothetical protein